MITQNQKLPKFCHIYNLSKIAISSQIICFNLQFQSPQLELYNFNSNSNFVFQPPRSHQPTPTTTSQFTTYNFSHTTHNLQLNLEVDNPKKNLNIKFVIKSFKIVNKSFKFVLGKHKL